MVRIVPENGKHHDPAIASVRWCRKIIFVVHFDFVITFNNKKNAIYSRQMIYVLVDCLEIQSWVSHKSLGDYATLPLARRTVGECPNLSPSRAGSMFLKKFTSQFDLFRLRVSV